MTATMVPTLTDTPTIIDGFYSDQNLRRILHAVLLHAMKEAVEEDLAGREARAWLLSRSCAELCENGGISYPMVRKWVLSGCPEFYKKRETAFIKNQATKKECLHVQINE